MYSDPMGPSYAVCPSSGGVYTTEALAASGLVYATEASAVHMDVSTPQGSGAAPGLVYSTKGCAAPGGVYTTVLDSIREIGSSIPGTSTLKFC